MLSYLGRSLRCSSQRIYRHLPLRNHRNFVTIRDSRLWIDGHKDPVPWVWLRDACQCEHCVHPSTKQKLHRSSDIPIDISPISANAIKVDAESLILEWPETSRGSQATHQSRYPLQWLERHASRSRSEAFFNPLKEAGTIKTWNAEKLKASPNLWVDYNSLAKEEPRRRAFKQLLQYGILFVKGVDTTHKEDENCELLNLSRKFGKIRDTFYGRVWNVKSIPLSRNIAYTNLNLDMHMDLL
jgi:gamma-butyrobetaine dioxygenase